MEAIGLLVKLGKSISSLKTHDSLIEFVSENFIAQISSIEKIVEGQPERYKSDILISLVLPVLAKSIEGLTYSEVPILLFDITYILGQAEIFRMIDESDMEDNIWKAYIMSKFGNDQGMLKMLGTYVTGSDKFNRSTIIKLWAIFKRITSEYIDAPAQLVIDAFKANLECSEGILSHLAKFIEDDIILKFIGDPLKYYGLYFPIVQSSGWGKSRIAIEISKHRFNGAFGCLRSSSSGYPTSNLELIDYIKSLGTVEAFEQFIVATYFAAEDEVLFSASDDIEKEFSNLTIEEKPVLPLYEKYVQNHKPGLDSLTNSGAKLSA